ncbi:LapA family protein [Radiobacillus deserti]|uniref:DUF1049 domain-containing protein n=1 Tax=Radiobacillus deserti TaxID=2594883 RepID=A0A516KH63_9BACI|nr:lipopolysaccharide assembly protein LapA domain-containing protein [Radiobacillus deserti]QDP40715.1 DUF1049 domain-containing protein [Radiobacillus deserti]
MKGQSYIITALLFALLVAIFAVINVEPVEVDYLFGTGNAPLILVILFSVLMGGIITASVGFVRILRLQREIKQLKKENSRLADLTPGEISLEEDPAEAEDEKKLDE